jgi:hypothetical protein
MAARAYTLPPLHFLTTTVFRRAKPTTSNQFSQPLIITNPQNQPPKPANDTSPCLYSQPSSLHLNSTNTKTCINQLTIPPSNQKFNPAKSPFNNNPLHPTQSPP